MTKKLTAKEAVKDNSKARAILTKRDKAGKPYQYVIAGNSLEDVKNAVHEEIDGQDNTGQYILVEYQELDYVSRGSKGHDFR